MPHQRPQRVPAVAVLVNVRHAAAQARLQLVRVVAEDEHDHAPGDRGEGGPGVVVDGAAQRLVGDDGEAGVGLDGEVGEAEADAGKDVDDNLLADGGDLAGAGGALAKDNVAAEEAGEEGVVGAWMRLAWVTVIEHHSSWIWEYPYPPCPAWARSASAQAWTACRWWRSGRGWRRASWSRERRAGIFV